MKHFILTAFKFSANEKAVLHILEKQKMGQNISVIARKAGVPRTTVIYILRKFKKLKIAKDVAIGRRNHWLINKMIWGK